MTLQEEVEFLRAENAELKKLLAEALAKIEVLERRIAELEGRGGPPPFVKPNKPKPTSEKKRKKRASEHNHARKREEPTRSVDHSLDRCPECNYKLDGQSVDRTRQVIELPEPQPVEIVEHRMIKRYCPHCEKWRSPKADFGGIVVGEGRIGIRLASLVAYLSSSLRLPVRLIQEHLLEWHGLRLSVGGIEKILQAVRKRTSWYVDGLKQLVRESPIVHADETGWRENGQNGYIWSFSTPGDKANGPVRYFERDESRAQAVLARILGDKQKGHLVSDFYCGYNDYAGPQQRCWVHLLRDLHELKEKHKAESEVVEWAESLRQTYDDAMDWLERTADLAPPAREAEYRALVGRTRKLASLHNKQMGHPCHALAQRLYRHEEELFQFVLVEGLSADNNLAERSVRPLVVSRKISGGTRSDEGSKTRMALASIAETARARHISPFAQFLSLLSTPQLTKAAA